MSRGHKKRLLAINHLFFQGKLQLVLEKLLVAREEELKAEAAATEEVLRFGQNGSAAFGQFMQAKQRREEALEAIYALLGIPTPKDDDDPTPVPEPLRVTPFNHLRAVKATIALTRPHR